MADDQYCRSGSDRDIAGVILQLVEEKNVFKGLIMKRKSHQIYQ